MLSGPWQHRHLIGQMVKREILGRYRGSFFGLLWSFVNPVLMLSIYTFVFSVVFQARWGIETGNKFGFALTLFSGLIVFNLFAECITQSPNLIVSNVNYVKRVIFPLEILPWVSLGSALFHGIINLFVLLLALVLAGQKVGIMVVLLPLIALPFVLLIMGFSWLLASVGVFLRDIGQVVGMSLTALMFMSPIFYPASSLPESVRGWLFLNPLTFIIEQTRNAVIWDRAPDWLGLGLYALVSLAMAWAGFFWFQKTRKGFADVV